MKEWFPVRTARDVVRAVLSEVSRTTSTSTGSSSGTDFERVPSLASLSILLGLVEAQLTCPHNLVPRDDDPSILKLSSIGRSKGTSIIHQHQSDSTSGTTTNAGSTLVGTAETADEKATNEEGKENKRLQQESPRKSEGSTKVNNHVVDSMSTTTTNINSSNNNNNHTSSIGDLKHILEEEDELLDFILPHPISYSRVKVLLEQFKGIVRGSIDLTNQQLVDAEETPEEVVARVADLIWSFLSPSSNDHQQQQQHQQLQQQQQQMATSDSNTQQQQQSSSSAHVQFLTSFLLERRLDSFGLTFAVLSALQVLFPRNFSSKFFLTLSEDHSWVSVRTNQGGGGDPSATEISGQRLSRVEVTWHGKTDKRVLNQRRAIGGRGGVPAVPLPDNWLYLRGHPVVCSRVEESVAALISSLNPSLSANSDSLPLAIIQRMLLAAFHEKGWLQKYPMAIGNLADVLELTGLPTTDEVSEKKREEFVARLYYEAITSAITHYDNHHIYPYLYLAGFWFRSQRWEDSLYAWKQASRVLSRYNYSPKEDEEAYKEFQEIATDLIPYALNQLMASPSGLNGQHYRDLIEFYDGLCAWEESSRSPVLHIVWSKSFISSLHKFPPEVRTSVRIVLEVGVDLAGVDGLSSSDAASEENSTGRRSSTGRRRRTSVGAHVATRRTASTIMSRDEIQELVVKCSQDPEYLLKDDTSLGVKEEGEEKEKREEEEQNSKKPEEGDGDATAEPDNRQVARVMSTKMSELKDILVKPEGKLNAAAIQLQITAQSSLFTVTKAPISRGHNNPHTHSSASPSSLQVPHHGHLGAGNQHSPALSTTSSASSSISPKSEVATSMTGRSRTGSASSTSASDAKKLRVK